MVESSGSAIAVKLVILGEARVGKTSLLLRYCRGVFDGSQESTLNASFLEKKIQVQGHTMSMNIWDTAG